MARGEPLPAVPSITPVASRTRALQVVKTTQVVKNTEEQLPVPVKPKGIQVVEFRGSPLGRRPWLSRLTICSILVVLCFLVLISAGIFQRSGLPQLSTYSGGQVYPVQIGGSMDLISTWQNSNGPLAPKKPIPANPGPYSILGKPTITVDFMNQVLASYNSPAAGKGKTLYDYGVKYGIDPVYALAFFLHESTMGTAGEARVSKSLGNLRCIPNHVCRDGYAWFDTWEQGFEAWYKLMRNLYVAQWGLITVDQIIPTYAPTADHNDEKGYIAALKHAIDTWHAGLLRP
jgi:hypothetical protein